MGNRSKFVALTAGAVGIAALRKRRHARLEPAAEGIAEAIMPSVADDIPREPEQVADVAHAPGHQHLAPAADEAAPVPRLRERPWTRQRHNLRHPGRV